MSFDANKLPLHPYYPIDLEIAGYIANEWDTLKLVSLFAAGCTVIFSVAYLVVMRVRPQISTTDLWTIMWFVLCLASALEISSWALLIERAGGFIHLFFEGYFAYNFRRMASMQDLFGQLWKEYSLSDSRYQTQNAFVLCMETITAVCWGPLSFVAASMVTTNHPLRHPIQAAVSLGQLYGDVLYYATSMFDHYILELSYSRPEAAYFWGYFVFMNVFWIVIPSILLYNSIKASGRAFTALAKMEEKSMANGAAKKTS